MFALAMSAVVVAVHPSQVLLLQSCEPTCIARISAVALIAQYNLACDYSFSGSMEILSNACSCHVSRKTYCDATSGCRAFGTVACVRCFGSSLLR